MDELEWLKEHSPSTRPSRDTTRRHRTQLRAAIAAEGADGGPPHRRARPRGRGRHRVLVTTACIVVLCAIGGVVVALASEGGDHGSRVGAPAASGSTTTPAAACSGPPPGQLAIPSGFGTGRTGPATDAATAPTSTQQVTTWSSERATIEQRWPSDANRRPWDQSGVAPDGVSGITESVIVDAKGGAHRTLLFGFPNQPKGCETLQITVYGPDVDTVRSVSDGLVQHPFVSPEPLVTTSQAAAAIPSVVACETTAKASAATDATAAKAAVDGTVTGTEAGPTFGRPEEALAGFLAGEPRLFQRGYDELRLADGSLAYVKQVRPGVVVTAVHVTAAANGWSVQDWGASGC